MKIHASDLPVNLSEHLLEKFKIIPRDAWRLTEYCFNRFTTRGIDMSTFISIWSEGFYFIEYHVEEKRKRNRVLLRSIKADSKGNQVCAVFCLDTKQIITIYANESGNIHKSTSLEDLTFAV